MNGGVEVAMVIAKNEKNMCAQSVTFDFVPTLNLYRLFFHHRF